MPREEVSTFQFSWCSIWKLGEPNVWVKICLAQERTLFDFVANNVIAVTSEFLRNNPCNQTNIFRLNVTLTTPRSQSCITKSFLQGQRFKIRSTIDQRARNTRLSCPPTLLQLHSCLLCYEICNRISRIIEWIFFMESRQASSIVFLIKT